MIAELSDVISEKGIEGLKATGPKADAYEALIELGYNQVEAKTALRMVSSKIEDSETMVKEALKNLS